MKRIIVLIAAMFALLLLIALPSFADDTTNASLSDAVYADLALRGYLDNVSISFFNGDPASNIGINETQHWLPASTVKLFAALYAYKQIADHKLNLTDTITADDKNVVPTELVTDELPTIQAGDSVSVDRLLKQMITQSDNTAFNIMLDVLDRKSVTDYIHAIGLVHSAVGSKLNLDTTQTQYEFDADGYGINTTTAADYTKAFTLIWQNKIAGAQPLLATLKQQKIRYMIPLLLPSNVVTATKHGDLDPLYHDGGIVFGPKSSYALSIFSNIGDPNLVAHLSQLIYTQNYDLVGAELPSNVSPNTVSEINPPIDPLVAEGKLLQTNTAVLGASTQGFPTQPITAADLGITAKDLSLTEQTTTLPHVVIPADSPWHILIPSWQLVKKAFVLGGVKARSEVDVQTMQIQVAEAKDLTARGKVQEANAVLHSVQQGMNSIASAQTTKSDTATQTTIQAISETRFQIFSDALKASKGTQRDQLIREIGQQAQSTLTNVQPNIPLATNATNPTQKPLVGEIVAKTDTSITVKTAGGQQITVPINDQTVTVKTKDSMPALPTIAVSPGPTISGSISPTIVASPTPTGKPTLASAQVGTTVALVGSSVGNKFTPTFVLTNVPKELAAPEPVVVVKVNKSNDTMVISENGVPVQVNVSNQTIIHGADTNVSFNEIKAGDVVVVHGKPLTPVVQPIVSPAPSIPSASVSPAPSVSQKISITAAPSIVVQPSGSVLPGVNKTTTPLPTQAVLPGVTAHTTVTTIPVISPTSMLHVSPSVTIPVVSSALSKPTVVVTTVPAPVTSAPSNPVVTTPPAVVQPKVIQSTSIQIIEKKQDTVAVPVQAQPAQSQPQQQSQPKTPPPPPPAAVVVQPVIDTQKKK